MDFICADSDSEGDFDDDKDGEVSFPEVDYESQGSDWEYDLSAFDDLGLDDQFMDASPLPDEQDDNGPELSDQEPMSVELDSNSETDNDACLSQLNRKISRPQFQSFDTSNNESEHESEGDLSVQSARGRGKHRRTPRVRRGIARGRGVQDRGERGNKKTGAVRGQRGQPCARGRRQNTPRAKIPKIIWDVDSNDTYEPKQIPFCGGERLKVKIGDNATIDEIFAQYFTGDIFRLIAEETNRYANQFIKKTVIN